MSNPNESSTPTEEGSANASNQPKAEAAAEPVAEASAGAGAPKAASADGPDATPAPTKLSTPPPPDPLQAMQAERDAMKNQLLRTMADFDNFRKRAVREKQDELRRGKEDILRELLPVFDNLERAASYAKTASDVKSIADGVTMVIKLFEDTLARVGASRIRAVGQAFDPNLHEAIQQVESAEHPAGTVAQELVPGYQFGDRLLRASMVVVSRGAPAPKTEGTPEGSN